MLHFRRLALVFVAVLFFASCGGSESSSGSGIGGTGITLIKGNVSSVDNQSVAINNPENTHNLAKDIANWLIPVSVAQAGSVSSLTVSGGGQSAEVNSAGQFVLPNVAPSANFVLTFTIDGKQNIGLGIGSVNKGTVVTVKDVAINTQTGSAKPDDIDKDEPVEKVEEEEDDISNDEDDQFSTDDDSTDDTDSEDPDDSDSSDDTEEDHESSEKE